MTAHRGREQEYFHSVNEAFWTSAVSEFKERMTQNEKTFKSVKVQIFDRAKKMFREIASGERQRLADEIGQRVNSETIPMSVKDRRLLNSSSRQKTKELRTRWESGPGTQKKQIDRSRIILLLKDLEELKLQLELQTRMLQLLDQSAPSISTYDLVEFMFRRVLTRMHGVKLASFESRYSQDSADSAYSAEETSSQTTIAITSEA